MKTKFTLLSMLLLFQVQSVFSQFTFVEEQTDNVGSNNYLDNVFCVVVSPDDKHLYAGSGNEDAITAYSINTADGSLTWVEEEKNGSAYDYISDMAFDCNGDILYVVEDYDDQVSWFTRTPATGALSYSGVIGSGNSPRTVLVHPDGDFVYVGCETEINIYNRSQATGVLTANAFSPVNTGVVPGIPICNPPYLRFIREVIISPDGNHLYVSSGGSDTRSVDLFSINKTNGQLTWVEARRFLGATCPGNETVAARPYQIDISEDGKYVYVAGERGDDFVSFDRNAATGVLTFKEEILTPGGQANYSIVVTPHSDQVLINESQGFSSGGVEDLHVYDVDASGNLSLAESFSDGVGGVTGIRGLKDYAFTSDSKYMYVAGANGDAIAVWNNTSKSVAAPTGCNPPLPLGVELMSFEAERVNENQVKVYWTTLSEINCDYFVVERSGDGVNFEEIGEIDGAGTSSQVRSYLFHDYEPLYSGSYYRLKQVDFDQTFTYSSVKFVPFGESCDYLVYIDQISGKINVRSGGCDLSGEVLLDVYDAAGRKVLSKIDYSRSDRMEVESSSFPKGVYFVRVKNGVHNYRQKVIVH